MPYVLLRALLPSNRIYLKYNGISRSYHSYWCGVQDINHPSTNPLELDMAPWYSEEYWNRLAYRYHRGYNLVSAVVLGINELLFTSR